MIDPNHVNALCDAYGEVNKRLGAQIASLTAENARLRAALEKYADEGNWSEHQHAYADLLTTWEGGCLPWAAAQEALKGAPDDRARS